MKYHKVVVYENTPENMAEMMIEQFLIDRKKWKEQRIIEVANQRKEIDNKKQRVKEIKNQRRDKNGKK